MIAIRSRTGHQIRRPRGLATADVPKYSNVSAAILFTMSDFLTDHLPSSRGREKLLWRREHSRPIVEAFWRGCDGMADDIPRPPQEPLLKAIAYRSTASTSSCPGRASSDSGFCPIADGRTWWPLTAITS